VQCERRLFAIIQEQGTLLTIKEFSRLTGIPESTLRYWDRIGLFQPALRHEDNQYRLYALEQVVSVNFVAVMSSLKLPLKTIAQIRDSRGPEKIISLLEQQEFEIAKEVARLQEIHTTLHILRDIFRQGTEAASGEIGVRRLGKTEIIMGPKNTYGKGELFYRALMEYCEQAKRNRVNPHNPIGGYHTSMELFLKEPSLPQHFFSIDPTGRESRPEGNYLVGYVQGYYGQLDGLPARMAAYAEENGLVCEGAVYVIYLLDDICVLDPTEYLAQVSVQVHKKR